MASTTPTKIVLKDATKMSLHDRFSKLGKRPKTSPETVRNAMRQERVASTQNRRLAQMLANRPAVQAALKLKKKSIKQRLGLPRTNVKARLNIAAANRNILRGRARGRGRVRGRARGAFRSPRGFRNGGNLSAQSGSDFNTSQDSTWSRGSPRGRFRGGRGRFRGGQSFGRGRGVSRGSFRGRGGRGAPVDRRGARGGRGRGRARRGVPPSREQLDNQLDQYMSGVTATGQQF